MAKIIFYCNDTVANIESMEYYRQDIEALRSLGHDVQVCNRYRDIPWRFDMIFVWWWTYALYPVLLARLTGRPAIINGVFNFRFENAQSGVDYFSRPFHQRLLIRFATKLASANLFVSKMEYDLVPDHFRLRRAWYAPCSVGDEYFAAGKRNNPRKGLLNIAWSGTENLKRKGVFDIILAVAELRQRGVLVDLCLAGKEGDGFKELNRQIVDLQLAECVKPVGEVSKEQKLDLYASAQLYLQPSYFEGFGLATAEAMAAGCCAVTTDVGEVRTVVGDCGLYVEPGNIAQLADAIEKLLSDQSLVDDLNRRAQERLRALFSFDAKKLLFSRILSEIGMINRS